MTNSLCKLCFDRTKFETWSLHGRKTRPTVVLRWHSLEGSENGIFPAKLFCRFVIYIYIYIKCVKACAPKSVYAVNVLVDR